MTGRIKPHTLYDKMNCSPSLVIRRQFGQKERPLRLLTFGLSYLTFRGCPFSLASHFYRLPAL